MRFISNKLRVKSCLIGVNIYCRSSGDIHKGNVSELIRAFDVLICEHNYMLKVQILHVKLNGRLCCFCPFFSVELNEYTVIVLSSTFDTSVVLLTFLNIRKLSQI